MTHFFAVGLGGMLGAMSRYGVAFLLGTSPARFPVGTLAVNVVGCLLGGLVAARLERLPDANPLWRSFLVVGVLGGFTTFSAFGLETLALLRRGDAGLAMVYAGSSVILGLGATWVGLRAG